MLQLGACDTAFYGRKYCHDWRQQLNSVPINMDDALDLERSGMDSVWLGALEVLKPCANDFDLYGQSPCEQLKQNLISRFVIPDFERDTSPFAALISGRKRPPLTRDSFDHQVITNPFSTALWDPKGGPTKTLLDWTIGADGALHEVTKTADFPFTLGADGQLHFVTTTSNSPFTTDKHGNLVSVHTAKAGVKGITTLPPKPFKTPSFRPPPPFKPTRQLPAWLTKFIPKAAPTLTLPIGHQELR
jgi:hypothetical protein